MGISFVENYENMTDEQIVSLINLGNLELMQIIIERYYSVALYNIKKYCPENYREDALQEATISLYWAVKDFDSSKAAFSTFAALCIKRSVLNVLKAHNRKKDIPEELISSIDGLVLVDNNSPEKIFFDKEDFKALTDYKSLKDTIKLELSELEYKVLELFLGGENYSDIAKKLGISEKSVDNSLSRVRKKLK